MQTPDEAIPGHVKSARERAGLSQADLARAMVKRGHDFRQQTIFTIENGKRRVSIGEAVDLAKALGTDLDRLVSGENFAISGEIRAWDEERRAFQSAIRDYAATLAALAVAADTKAESDLERDSVLSWVQQHTPSRVADARWFIKAVLTSSGDIDGAAASALVAALDRDRAALGVDDG